MTLQSDNEPRCEGCNKLLGLHLTRPWVVVCPRCKARNEKKVHSVEKKLLTQGENIRQA